MDGVLSLGDLMLGAKFIARTTTKSVDVGLFVSLVFGVPQKTLAIMAKFIARTTTKSVDVGLFVSLVFGVPQKTLAIMPNKFGG
ncbi:MAG: hypothetical protein KME01_12990 [Chroococcus sp. CMT-3BRIN-NPC107]|jgi:hypothetical protein|nr:hypothetical protein [Chroococcus sp. CMT-3BRIN-NPC107]